MSPSETGHAEAARFIRTVRAESVCLVEPPQFILEVAAAFSRNPRDVKAVGFMVDSGGIEIESCDFNQQACADVMIWMAEKVKIPYPCKGADMAYVSVAMREGLPLVTADNGILKLSQFAPASGFHVLSPADGLRLSWS